MQKNEKRVVVSDIGGVVWPLIDMRAWREKLFHENSLWFTKEEFERANMIAEKIAWKPFERGQRDDHTFQILFQALLGLEHLDPATFWNEYVNIFYDTVNEPLLECFCAMRDRGVVLALLSNVDEARLKYVMRNRAKEYKKIMEIFHYHFFSCRMDSRKPEPTIYRKALETISVLPVHTYYIEDFQPNIDGMAAATGMPRENMHLYHRDRHEEAVAFFRRRNLI